MSTDRQISDTAATVRFLEFVAEALDAAITRQPGAPRLVVVEPERPRGPHTDDEPTARQQAEQVTRLRAARARIADLLLESGTQPDTGRRSRRGTRLRGRVDHLAARGPRAAVVAPVAAVAFLAAVGVHGGPRSLAALWFLVAVPAQPYVKMLRVRDRVTGWVLVIGASLGLDTIVAEVMLYTHTWSATAAFVFLAVTAVAGSTLEVRRARRTP